MRTLLILAIPLFVACANGNTQPNLCGGEAALSFTPGSPCGACGEYICDGEDAVVCDDPGDNGCGGCDQLEGVPGDSCGPCQEWVCNGTADVVCEDSGTNACGGCAALGHELGGACGECGHYVCDGIDALTCEESSPNGCGGCGVLPHTLGDSCGQCGVWTCDAQNPDNVVCDEILNECGGCETLAESEGDPCGQCGQLVCSGTDSFTCDDPGANQCGGCAALPGAIGDSCACGEGTFDCDGTEALVCLGAGQDTFGSPMDLGSFEDSDDTIYSLLGTLDPVSDTEDWYVSYAADTWTGVMDIRAWLENIPPNHNYDLCVFYDPGRDSTVTCVTGIALQFSGLNGCCSTFTGSQNEHVELEVDAHDTGDEDGYFYYRVFYQSGAGDCTQYSLEYAF